VASSPILRGILALVDEEFRFRSAEKGPLKSDSEASGVVLVHAEIPVGIQAISGGGSEAKRGGAVSRVHAHALARLTRLQPCAHRTAPAQIGWYASKRKGASAPSRRVVTAHSAPFWRPALCAACRAGVRSAAARRCRAPLELVAARRPSKEAVSALSACACAAKNAMGVVSPSGREIQNLVTKLHLACKWGRELLKNACQKDSTAHVINAVPASTTKPSL
jgi:hypothetical protein